MGSESNSKCMSNVIIDPNPAHSLCGSRELMLCFGGRVGAG